MDEELITVEEFVAKWKSILDDDFPSFVKNMSNEAVSVKRSTFLGWLKTWLAWQELSTDWDMENHYG